MSQREAFEAWVDERDKTHGGKLRSEAAGLDYPLGRLLDECWKAAIQHARDVAGVACLNVASPESTPYADGYNQGSIDCYDAIKEALK